MNNEQPSFIEFAAIQIFAAMVVAYGNPESFRDVDARAAWDLAKMLHDAKPKDAPDEPT